MQKLYDRGVELGSGSTGDVRLVEFAAPTDDGTVVQKAVKYFFESDDLEEELDAIRLLQKHVSPAARRFFAIDHVQRVEELFLVLDYQGKTLIDWVEAKNGLVWPGDADKLRFGLSDSRNLCLQVFEAAAHLHKQHIIHGDIRPENVCSLDGKAWVLIDFGLTERLDPGKPPSIHTFLGPSCVRAPENKEGYESVITTATEVFMAALTVWTALNGLDFSLESLYKLERRGRLPNGELLDATASSTIPSMQSGEDTEGFESRVAVCARKHYETMHKPFFQPYLAGSLLYPPGEPLVKALLPCMEESPAARPTAAAALGFLNDNQ